MKDYLFRFGYCTPAQRRANETHGWDDECSSAFFVRAKNADDAISWGSEVAERFVANLFERAGWKKIPSWKDDKFAHWIDDDPSSEFSVEDMARLPLVIIHQLPDFDDWLE